MGPSQLALNAITMTHMVDDSQGGVFAYWKDAVGTEIVLHANKDGVFDSSTMVGAQSPVTVEVP